jgi:hypothetical protein
MSEPARGAAFGQIVSKLKKGAQFLVYLYYALE